MDKKPIYRNPRDWVLEPVSLAAAETIDYPTKMLGVEQLWKQTKGKGIKVAVLDTGCDLDHPDLDGAILAAEDFSGSRYGPLDLNDHGTWCAGVIGARANDSGVIGIAPECQLLIGKVLGDSGAGSDRSIAAGLEWALAQGADIISMSLGGSAMPAYVRDICKRFVSQQEHFLIGAAGNEGQRNGDTVNYPARWEEFICVAAVDSEGKRAPFSSRGSRVDIAAPGVNCLSTIPRSKGGYGRMSGTSMATPIVAALTALCLAKHKTLGGNTPVQNVTDLREHLKKTAIDKGTPGRDNEYGFGLIDPVSLNDVWNKQDEQKPSPMPIVPTGKAKVLFNLKLGEKYLALTLLDMPVKNGDVLEVNSPKAETGLRLLAARSEISV